MKTNKDTVFSTPEIEGQERQVVIFTVPTPAGNVHYRCVRWANLGSHWLLELPEGDQVEIWNPDTYMIRIPQPGYTYDSELVRREVQKTSGLIIQ